MFNLYSPNILKLWNKIDKPLKLIEKADKITLKNIFNSEIDILFKEVVTSRNEDNNIIKIPLFINLVIKFIIIVNIIKLPNIINELLNTLIIEFFKVFIKLSFLNKKLWFIGIIFLFKNKQINILLNTAFKYKNRPILMLLNIIIPTLPITKEIDGKYVKTSKLQASFISIAFSSRSFLI